MQKVKKKATRARPRGGQPWFPCIIFTENVIFQDFWRKIGWNSVFKNWIFQQKAEYSRGYTVIPAYPGNKLTIKEWFLTISTHKIYLNSHVLAFWQNISWNSMHKNRLFQQTSGCFKGYTDILEVSRRQTYFRKMISNPHCNALPIKPTKKSNFPIFRRNISWNGIFKNKRLRQLSRVF